MSLPTLRYQHTFSSGRVMHLVVQREEKTRPRIASTVDFSELNEFDGLSEILRLQIHEVPDAAALNVQFVRSAVETDAGCGGAFRHGAQTEPRSDRLPRLFCHVFNKSIAPQSPMQPYPTEKTATTSVVNRHFKALVPGSSPGQPTTVNRPNPNPVATSDLPRFARGRCKTPRCRNLRCRDRLTCHRCHQRAWRERRPMQAAYATLRDHARGRRIEFAIPFAYFSRFASRTRYVERTGLYAWCLTVDRIDNLRGYVPGNIQPLTRAANSEKRMKQDACRMRAGMEWRCAA